MNRKQIYMLLSALLVLAACSQTEHESVGTDDDMIRITASVKENYIKTRAGTPPEDGTYYLYYSPADPSDNAYTGLKAHTYTSVSGTLSSTTSLYWDDINETKKKFYLTNTSSMDFSTNGLSGKDILFDAYEPAWKGGLTFELNHLMSKITVELIDGTLKGDIDLSVSKVAFYPGLTRIARGIDYSNARIRTRAEDKEEITTITVDENGVVGKTATLSGGIFAPQIFTATDSLEITTKEYVYRIPVPKDTDTDSFIDLKAGEHLAITITLQEDIVDATADLTDWEPKTGGDIDVSRVFNIGNWHELRDLMQAINTGYTFKGMVVRLMKPIELQGQISLGTEENPFEGIFDGNGMAIKYLGGRMVDGEIEYNAGGLFGYTRGATLQNVVLEVPYVKSNKKKPMGGLVDIAENTTFFNCRTQSKDGTGADAGEITGNDQYTGGLVGIAKGTSSLINCYSYVKVRGGTEYVGGLIGYSEASLTHCFAKGAVESPDASYVGGLVGFMNGIITDCYAQGDIIAYSQAGGLIGLLDGKATYCYASGEVSGTGSECGGLLGVIGFDGMVNYCYWKANLQGAGSALPGTCVRFNEAADILTDLNGGRGTIWTIGSDGLPAFSFQ